MTINQALKVIKELREALQMVVDNDGDDFSLDTAREMLEQTEWVESVRDAP